MRLKLLLVIPVFFISGIAVFAQKDIPSFGKVDKSDLDMKQCTFDEAAEAVVLFDVAEVYCFLNLNSVANPLSSQMERHVRIKILSKKGLDYANIRIPFISGNNLEEIKNISAETINQDEAGNLVITKMEKNSIFIKKKNKRYSEVTFALPDVKVGSIIEYKYKADAMYLSAVKNWFFQMPIPVRLSRYVLNFPPELVISAQPKGLFQVNLKESNRDARNIKTFEMQNVPALRDESFISCDRDYLQHLEPYLVSLNLPGQVSRSLVSKWPDVINRLMEDEDFGLQLKKNIPRTSDLDAMLVNVNDPYKKMVIIHNYVRSNMVWNDMYGIWALYGVKTAWKEKKGTSGEINLILVNMLKDADLDAFPFLVSTRENGRVNLGIADEDQFNKVMAYVIIGEKRYILDATNKFTPVQLFPPDILYSEGLLIKKTGSSLWGWQSVTDEAHYFDNYTSVEATIDDKGMISGKAIVNSSDYSRLKRMPELKKGKAGFIETYFNSTENNIKVSNLVIENEDKDSLPLMQICTFTQPVNSSGNFSYFNVNIFSGLEKNPFIADTRFSDIFFGAQQLYTIESSYTLPPGYSFDALPKNILMRLPDTSIVFKRFSSIHEKKLSVRIDLEFKKPFYTIEEYDAFHEFYKKLFSLLNEQYVYKKD